MNIKTTIALLVTASLAACVIEPPKGDVELAQLAVTATPVVSATPVVTDTVATPTPAGEVTPTVTPNQEPTPTPTPTLEPGVPDYEGEVTVAYWVARLANQSEIIMADSYTGEVLVPYTSSLASISAYGISDLSGKLAFVSDSKLMVLDYSRSVSEIARLDDFSATSAVPLLWVENDQKILLVNDSGSLISVEVGTGLTENVFIDESVVSIQVHADGAIALETDAGAVYSGILGGTFEQMYSGGAGSLAEWGWCGSGLVGMTEFPISDKQVQRRLVRMDGGALDSQYITFAGQSANNATGDVLEYECSPNGNYIAYITNYKHLQVDSADAKQLKVNLVSGSFNGEEEFSFDLSNGATQNPEVLYGLLHSEGGKLTVVVGESHLSESSVFQGIYDYQANIQQFSTTADQFGPLSVSTDSKLYYSPASDSKYAYLLSGADSLSAGFFTASATEEGVSKSNVSLSEERAVEFSKNSLGGNAVLSTSAIVVPVEQNSVNDAIFFSPDVLNTSGLATEIRINTGAANVDVLNNPAWLGADLIAVSWEDSDGTPVTKTGVYNVNTKKMQAYLNQSRLQVETVLTAPLTYK